MNGVLVLDKPAGITSHDAIDVCRRRLGVRRVGHAGTLDPPATGVLVVGVGRATRLLRFLEAHDKEYRAEVVLGATTSTEDATGEVLSESDAAALAEGDVAAVLQKFAGEIEQVPPMVSAIKVGGERLYRKARRGEEVDRPPRRVRIEEIVLESFTPGSRACAVVRVRCSKGTYIRSLARDIGAALGPGGHVAGLRRLAVGPFRAEQAIAPEAVDAHSIRPMEDAVAGYPRHTIAESDAVALAHGRSIAPAGISGAYAVVGPHGIVAMAEDRDGRGRPLCVLVGGGGDAAP